MTAFYRSPETFKVKARHLGGQHDFKNSNKYEIINRVKSLVLAYNMFGAFWYNRSPFQFKRMVMIAVVYNAALSGLITRARSTQEASQINNAF